MNKKLIALLLLCSVIIFTGCASQESGGVAQPKIVTYAYQSEPVVFWDPMIHFQMKSL